MVVEDVDPNGKISLKPAGDVPAKGTEAPALAEDPTSDDGVDEAPVTELAGDDGDDVDETLADDVDETLADDDAGPIEASFEDAFKAELETVHGDLGVAAPANRGGGGGGRRRRR